MAIKDRVEQAPACSVISLTEAEKDSGVYTGAGWKLARFQDGALVELFDPLEHAPYSDDPSESATDALGASIEWARQAEGEVWLVMCSCYQLCEPEPFSWLDARAVARLGRLIGDSLSGNF